MMSKTLGIVFSNMHDSMMGKITEHRTMASVPFGGRYRLVDFVLSNMINSGVKDVGIITKSNFQSLMDHVGTGKEWDLSRKKEDLLSCLLMAVRSRFTTAVGWRRWAISTPISRSLRRSWLS